MKKVKNWGHLAALAAFSLVLGGAASCNPPEPTDSDDWDTSAPASWNPEFRCSGEGGVSGLDLGRDDLGLDSTIIITFNGSEATVSVTPYSDFVFYDTSGAHVELRINVSPSSYSIILSGTTSKGSLTFYSGEATALYLNGVSITNPRGPAINIQSTKRIDVHLVSCDRRNFLQDGPDYPTVIDGEDAKGAFFSEGQLIFQGGGALEVRAKNNRKEAGERGGHAIVSDDYIVVESGDIIVYESTNDCIHANGRIEINGGEVQARCVGDGIQNERLLPVTVSGGKVTVRTTGEKGHGIVSGAGGVVIKNNPDINITLTGDGSKGIRSRGDVKIEGGTIYIDAHGRRNALNPDNGTDTSAASGIKADGSVEISGGKLTIKCTRAGQKAKGINVDYDVVVRGGETEIRADGDGVKVRGYFEMTSGYLYARSKQSKDIDYDETNGSNFFDGGNLDAGLNTRKGKGDY